MELFHTCFLKKKKNAWEKKGRLCKLVGSISGGLIRCGFLKFVIKALFSPKKNERRENSEWGRWEEGNGNMVKLEFHL